MNVTPFPSFSKLQFLHLQNGGGNDVLLVGIVEMQYLPQNKFSRDFYCHDDKLF
jgi:hypothetical protein